MAYIPFFHSGLPVAHVQELRCVVRGDECCEWIFTWQKPAQYNFFERFSWSRRPAARQQEFENRLAVVDRMVSQDKPIFRLDTKTTNETTKLPSLMVGHPFGLDQSGNAIKSVTGTALNPDIEYCRESRKNWKIRL